MNFLKASWQQYQKGILLVGAVVAISFVVTLFIISGGKSAPSQQNPSQDREATIVGNSTSITPTSVQSISLSQVFQSGTYIVSYPSEFTNETFQYPSGDGVVFKRQGAGDNGPMLTIVTESIQPTGHTLSQRQELYEKLGFTKESFKLGSASATKLSGSLQPQTASKLTIWETHIYLDRGTRSFLTVYKYEAEKKDPQLESLFTQMLSTFSFL